MVRSEQRTRRLHLGRGRWPGGASLKIGDLSGPGRHLRPMQETRSSLGQRPDLQELAGEESHRIVAPAYRVGCGLRQNTGTAPAGDDAEIFGLGTGNDA